MKDKDRIALLDVVKTYVVKEIGISLREGTPTSRLTSLYNKVCKLQSSKKEL